MVFWFNIIFGCKDHEGTMNDFEAHYWDNDIINLLDSRFRAGIEIAKIKKNRSMPLENKEVEKKVVERALEFAEKYDNYSPKQIRQLMRKIIKWTKAAEIREVYSAA